MKHNKVLKAFGITAAVVALVLVSIVPAAAQDDVPRDTISVSGFGEASGAPDVAYLQLGVNLTGDNVGSVVGEVNGIMESVRSALVEAGIAKEDMQTANFNVWSDERYQDGGPTGERFYRAENMIRIVVRDVDQVQEIIDVALEAGATNLYGLNFGLEDPAGLEQEARLDAIADARDRAEKLAEALGLELGAPISVSESPGFEGPMPAMVGYGGGGGGGGGPVVEQGQLTVQVQVHITFAVAK